jgi:hypothetical protein
VLKGRDNPSNEWVDNVTGERYVISYTKKHWYVENKKHANELKIANGLREFWKLQGKRKWGRLKSSH